MVTASTELGLHDSSRPKGIDRRWRVFAISLVVAALATMDISKVNVGVPSIERALDATALEIQITVAGYALAFGLALIPAGRYGDLRSRRRILLVGLSGFAAASLGCALAPTPGVLATARLCQGLAAGMMTPQVFGVIQQMFIGRDRARAFGIFGAVISIGVALGPTLGGLLIAVGGPTDGWRLLFLVNVPLAAVLLPIAYRLIPRNQAGGEVARGYDAMGVALLGLSTVLLLTPIVLTTGAPGDDPRRWWCLLAAGIGAVLFLIWEGRYQRAGKSPLIDLEIFTLASFRMGVLVTACLFGSLSAALLMTTLFLQQGLGVAPVFSGMASIPFALFSAVSAWVVGHHIDRLRSVAVLTGLVIATGGLVGAALIPGVLPASYIPWVIAGALGIVGLGSGLASSGNHTQSLQDVPAGRGGMAGSIAQVGQRIGAATGIAASTSVFYSSLPRGATMSSATEFLDAYLGSMLAAAGLMALGAAFGFCSLVQARRRPMQ